MILRVIFDALALHDKYGEAAAVRAESRCHAEIVARRREEAEHWLSVRFALERERREKRRAS